MRGRISADIEFGPKDYFLIDGQVNGKYRFVATCGDGKPIIFRVDKRHLLNAVREINELLRHEEEAVVEAIVGVQPAGLTVCSI